MDNIKLSTKKRVKISDCCSFLSLKFMNHIFNSYSRAMNTNNNLRCKCQWWLRQNEMSNNVTVNTSLLKRVEKILHTSIKVSKIA